MADKEKMIEQLKSWMLKTEPLQDEPEFHTNLETIARYLKSRDWKIDEAFKLLKDTVEYRRQLRPLRHDCRWCHERPGYHSMRQVGHDEMGRPVIYSNFAQASTHQYSVEDSVSHVTYLIENAKLTMKPGISTWVLVIDCTGMTLHSCNPKLGYGVTQIMANHYPERLGLVICLNHSPIFHGVWKAIKIFLHDNTVTKMKLIRTKRKIQPTFQQYFSEDLTNWLLEEIKLNKAKPLPRDQQAFWSPPSDEGQHDPRGCRTYVNNFIDQFQQNSKTTSSFIHRPHPNVIDALNGKSLDIRISPDVEEARATAQAVVQSDSTESEDEPDAGSIEIGEEFQIPKSALRLST